MMGQPTENDYPQQQEKVSPLKQTHDNLPNITHNIHTKLQKIALYQKQLKALTSYVKDVERALTFYRIESNFYKTTTTKKSRQSRREQKMTKTCQSDIKKIMNQDIFPFVKFIDKHQLQSLSRGSIAMKLMTQLKIPEDQMSEFWA